MRKTWTPTVHVIGFLCGQPYYTLRESDSVSRAVKRSDTKTETSLRAV